MIFYFLLCRKVAWWESYGYFQNLCCCRKICMKTSQVLCENQYFLKCGHLYQNLLLLSYFSEAATGGVLKNFAKFKGKHLCQSLTVSLGPANLFKKWDSDAGIFLWILWNIKGHLFLLNTPQWLLLTFYHMMKYFWLDFQLLATNIMFLWFQSMLIQSQNYL